MKSLSALLGCAIFMFVHTKAVFARATPLPSNDLQCEEGTEFWDKAMENCQSCYSYCSQHAAMGLTEDCEKKCPTYMRARQCDPVTEFWDTAMDNCQSCDSYCSHHAVMGLTEDCEKKCPEYMQARRCDEVSFYDDKLEACAPCSSLCTGRHVDTGECQRQCPRYFVNVVALQDVQKTSEATNQSNATAAASSRTSSAVSWSVTHIIVVVVLVLALGFAAVVLVLHKLGKLCPPKFPQEAVAVDEFASGSKLLPNVQKTSGATNQSNATAAASSRTSSAVSWSVTHIIVVVVLVLALGLSCGGPSYPDLSIVTKAKGEMYHPGPHAQPTT